MHTDSIPKTPLHNRRGVEAEKQVSPSTSREQILFKTTISSDNYYFYENQDVF
jgi:hypothetical protein